MERLTQTSNKGGVAFTFDLDITCKPSEAQKILKLAEKLKFYEDAEEQGLLLRLPCAIGSTIYKFEYPTRVDENGDEWTVIDKKRATVVPLKFALCHLGRIGDLYFLTREEAEKALEDMKGKV